MIKLSRYQEYWVKRIEEELGRKYEGTDTDAWGKDFQAWYNEGRNTLIAKDESAPATHPQNRMIRLIGRVYNIDVPKGLTQHQANDYIKQHPVSKAETREFAEATKKQLIAVQKLAVDGGVDYSMWFVEQGFEKRYKFTMANVTTFLTACGGVK